jgi:hypothetical protein
MKWWATLARYACRSEEFQVRLPFGCRKRAELARLEMGRGRVEKGTLVLGGRNALMALQDLGGPVDLQEAAARVVGSCPVSQPAAWEQFRAKLKHHLVFLLDLRLR